MINQESEIHALDLLKGEPWGSSETIQSIEARIMQQFDASVSSHTSKFVTATMLGLLLLTGAAIGAGAARVMQSISVVHDEVGREYLKFDGNPAAKPFMLHVENGTGDAMKADIESDPSSMILSLEENGKGEAPAPKVHPSAK